LLVPIWNATIANLTLMALGSSAPEILLSIIEACGTLGEPAGPLGASTIVGSAAFNLLVISAVSVIAVEEPKKILDVSVFFVTSVFSIFAYVWLYSCLAITTKDQVTVKEAWLTLIYFFILLGLAFLADRAFAAHLEKQKSAEDKEREQAEENLKIKKNQLRQLAKIKGGDQTIMEVAQGIINNNTKKISENEQREIKSLFMEILGTKDLGSVDVKELHSALQPDSLLERFAARNANKIGPTKDFLSLKGQKGQIENIGGKVEQENELIGFKCLHYSVTESSGFVEVTVVKKTVNQDITFGLRTVNGTAKEPNEYTKIDEILTMKKRETEKTV
jgi:solute carrier family 8 (sodium/calcium exchanger)